MSNTPTIGTIRLKRRSAFSAAARTMDVRLDGVVTAGIRSGQTITLTVTPGVHQLQIGPPGSHYSDPLDVDVPAGRTVDAECWPLWRWTAPYWGLSLLGATAPVPVSPAPVAPHATVPVQIVEGHRTEENLGEEVRTIDNRASASAVSRSVKASREWTRTLSVHFDQARTNGRALTAGPAWLNAQASIETTLQRNYGTETVTRHLMEEEISLTVPPRTLVHLTLRWKRIVQHGIARATSPSGTPVEVPFQLVVGVTFDQVQRTVT